MKSIKDIPEHERPRERLFAKGADALSDQELLAVILGKGTKAHDVLALSRMTIKIIDDNGIGVKPEDLTDIDGMGRAKAALLCAAFEFVRRRIRPEGVKIGRPSDILPLIQHYTDRKQEHFLCIALNGANEVIYVHVITIGLVNQSHVHPREVFADVITERASAVIIAHNHPSGRLEPSPEDCEITQRIKAASQILGIELLDHIIFARTGYYSFSEHELM